MLRKSVWITALLLALTFVFFGCDDSKYAKLDILDWKLSSILGADAAAVSDTQLQTLSSGAIKLAGDPDVAIVNGALQFTTKADWGQGIDLQASAFGFKVGDKITVTGTADTNANAKLVRINAKPNAENVVATGGDTGTNFSLSGTLTAAHITDIGADAAKGIRIQLKANAATFTITEITLKR